jgi:hypothetical protein
MPPEFVNKRNGQRWRVTKDDAGDIEVRVDFDDDTVMKFVFDPDDAIELGALLVNVPESD